MKSQSARYSIGYRSRDPPVQTMSYSTLPKSPKSRRDATEKVITTNEPSNAIIGSGKYVFIPQKDDVVKQRFRLRYSPCSDAYHRELKNCILTRVEENVRGWEKGVYSFDSVERIVDTKNNLVYLERTSGSNTGILCWKIDFAPCSLVVDQVSVKVESRCLNGGEVLVMLASGNTKKTISHMEGLGLVDIKDFQNAKSLVLSIHLIGETSEQQTRLFEKNILSEDEFPLDLKVTLKPPAEMHNKPIILLGLMFSNSQETTVDRSHYRSHSNSAGKGFLHINIVQGKNIAHSKDSFPDAQVKCYLLPDEKNLKSCKTRRMQKASSPMWDEYFVIDGVAQAQLRRRHLSIQVVNWRLSMNKKNSLLGEVTIGSKNVFDSHSLISPVITTPSELCEEKLANLSLPLVHGDVAGGRRPLSSFEVGRNNQSRSSTTGSIEGSDDEKPSGSDNTGITKRLKDTSTYDKGTPTGVSVHVSKAEIITNNNGVNKTNNKDGGVSSLKLKPPRPPPPSRLPRTNGHLSPDGALSPTNDFGNKSDPYTLNTSRRVYTPTFSLLMSPKRGCRLSCEEESDLSMRSPRDMNSPADHQSFQFGQWDIMIARPKQWIYCWQTLCMSASE